VCCSSAPAEHKGDHNPDHGSNRADGSGSDQNALAVLLEKAHFRFGLAVLRFQEQLAVKSPAIVGIRCHRHQDSLQLLGQI
jgi:hypothetical protein